MQITIRTRNVEFSDGHRVLVEEKLTRLARLIDESDRIEVCLSEARNPRIAEKDACDITVHGRKETLRASGAAAEIPAAVDVAIAKLEHRIEKVRGKVLARTHGR